MSPDHILHLRLQYVMGYVHFLPGLGFVGWVMQLVLEFEKMETWDIVSVLLAGKAYE